MSSGEAHIRRNIVVSRAAGEAAIERADGRCQLCNCSADLQLHHRTYERQGYERASDLTLLCRRCHEWFHYGALKETGCVTGTLYADPSSPREVVVSGRRFWWSDDE